MVRVFYEADTLSDRRGGGSVEQRKCKVAFCWCGKGIFIMAALPYAETNRSSIIEFARYASEGFRIDYIPIKEAADLFYKCDCYKKVLNGPPLSFNSLPNNI